MSEPDASPTPSRERRPGVVSSRERRRGVALCVGSGVTFGLLGAFGTLAFRGGSAVTEVLMLRFATAAVLLWLVVLITRRRLPRGRALVQAVLLGAVGYAAQALLYFSALERLSVGLTSLLLYTFPVLVITVALVTGRERLRWPVPVAAALAVGGVALTVTGSGGRVDGLGILLGLGAAVVYTGYYLGMDTLPASDPLAVAAVICTAAAAVHLVITAVGPGLRPPPAGSMGWIALLAVVSTVTPIVLLLAGIRLAGASTAAVVSCAEPLTAVVVGAVFFGDPFGLPQLVGALLVVVAVVLLGRRSPALATTVAPHE